MCLAILLVVGLGPSRAAEKTDVVFLENGDRLTGEVKGLERGKLTLKTDSLGTVAIQWEDIASITSTQTLELELDSGEKFFGSLTSDTEAGQVGVAGEAQSEVLDLASVVRIVPIEGVFWKRLDGSLNLGAGFTSANKSTQLTLGSDVRYRSRKYMRRIGLSSTVVDQEDAERTKRQSLDASLQRFLPKRRFTTMGLQFQENEELGLELRSLVTAVFGRHAVQTNHVQLDLFAGLAQNREDFLGSAPEASTEAVAGLDLAVFRFDDPETDVRVELFVYPSLSESGRVRAEFDASIRRELVKDFFWAISLYDSFDSEPPREDFPTNDWGMNTSLGWSF